MAASCRGAATAAICWQRGQTATELTRRQRATSTHDWADANAWLLPIITLSTTLHPELNNPCVTPTQVILITSGLWRSADSARHLPVSPIIFDTPTTDGQITHLSSLLVQRVSWHPAALPHVNLTRRVISQEKEKITPVRVWRALTTDSRTTGSFPARVQSFYKCVWKRD